MLVSFEENFKKLKKFRKSYWQFWKFFRKIWRFYKFLIKCTVLCMHSIGFFSQKTLSESIYWVYITYFFLKYGGPNALLAPSSKIWGPWPPGPPPWQTPCYKDCRTFLTLLHVNCKVFLWNIRNFINFK